MEIGLKRLGLVGGELLRIMRVLTKSEAREWCISHHIHLDDRQFPQPDFDDIQCRDFKIPNDTGRRIALLKTAFRGIPEDQEILLWFTQWGVWQSSERPHMFERFRASYGEHRSLSEVPAYEFDPTEREDLISFAGFAMLFLWDCHVLSSTGDAWLFLSHDECGWLCAKRTESLPHLTSFS